MFKGKPADLESLIAYEREALEFVRTTLFDQSEASNAAITVDIAKPTLGDGFHPVSHGLVASGHATGTEAVKSALSRLRPLAFSSAFKMNDMMAEWILQANGLSGWTFKEKIDFYHKRKSANNLEEPVALANWPTGSGAFWSLFETLVDYRNALTHRSSFALQGENLRITSKTGTIDLSDSEQASYIRAMCLIGDTLSSGADFDSYIRLLVESDLHVLSNVHKVTGLGVTAVRRGSVVIKADASMSSTGEETVSLDFDYIKKLAERQLLPGPGILAYDLVVRVRSDLGGFEWHFPVGSVPTGSGHRGRNDPEFLKYAKFAVEI